MWWSLLRCALWRIQERPSIAGVRSARLLGDSVTAFVSWQMIGALSEVGAPLVVADVTQVERSILLLSDSECGP